MRMRKKTHLDVRLERQQARLIHAPAELRGRWRTLMPGCEELRLELGCGKGRFTVETARREPGVLFVAVERVPDAMIIAVERADALGLDNVYFLDADARDLPDYFAPDEVDRIYLNFSDPWPSNRQAKRRLTHPDFLRVYARILRAGGEVQFKTDNRDLFQWSLFQFPKAGFGLTQETWDLHARGPQGVMTDYEEKFVAQGKPICRCVAVKGKTLSARITLDGPDASGAFRAVDGAGETLGRAVVPPDGAIYLEIDPHRRRRGYGVELLGLALDDCRERLGLTQVEVTCQEDNVAAIRTILHYRAQRVDLPGDGDAGRRRYRIHIL